ncbi:MAG: hypothetical protein ACT6Q9_05815 [Polaromonas sp.]|uniref:hypothetical protein n=1 Tax=Polaromonas sp. TaxID=1869339 RepID=UPI0040352AB5
MASAQIPCTVDFFQADVRLHPVQEGDWHVVRLAKAPFKISVSPPECQPLLATLPTPLLAFEVAQFSALVFGPNGHGFAASPESADILHWPSRMPIRTTLKDISQSWAVIDTYKAEADRLGYPPQPVLAWGAAFVFQEGAKQRVASFRRLTESVALDSALADGNLPAVIYLNIKELMKPTWHNAVAPFHLLKPYKVIFEFK